MNQTWQSKTAATVPAVSVRSLVSPSDTGIKFFCKASSISSLLKSPSGPIRMVEWLNGGKVESCFLIDASSQ